jgi:hypothetical protein
MTYPRDIAGFPFPFVKDRYRFSTDVEPSGAPHESAAGAWAEDVVWVEPGEYERYAALRSRLLREGRQRYDLAPHMQPAGWDAMLFLMRQMAGSHPEHFDLDGEDPSYVWRNRLLGLEQPFVVGDRATLPADPLEYFGPQITEDVLLLDQRDGHLWLEGGVLAFLWSVPFTRGMSFTDMHSPIPRMTAEGVTARTEQFLMRMEPGQVFRRVAWLFQPDDRLDISVESSEETARARPPFDPSSLDEIGARIHLRSELQHLVRLPHTGAILFMLGTRMLSLERVTTVPEWARTTLSFVETLPDDIVPYKSVAPLREHLLRYLRPRVAALDEG